MASLADNIKQAIADFDEIKAAIEESGISVPVGTDTKEYGNLIRQAVKKAASSNPPNSETTTGEITLTDRTTGAAHTIYVDGGRLSMEKTAQPVSSADSVNLTDRTTGAAFLLLVDNENLTMEEK